ncbi:MULTISPECIES: hypothetical protein [Streptomyces]|uniref:Uncharacterized protein n=1 Tax=Streptomyces rubiginosohelvolus TaxID=67362 RepID=A0ABQ3C1P9_9ACTN|nr:MULTISPECIES: hypothetical protein [Streptomyces]MCA1270211.1 hypothetical protein [Streptomyces sp. 7G]RUP68748.1 hypothetical protein SSPNP10_08390 [Streptomyces sp. NP10]WST54738.1 hypothetical protein OG475_18665 [Streptomyces rubiginosohelvolus]GGR79039.1 hypothetical protein GCM10010284_10210 [Streptomyces rubiginosohelvolus]GGZ64843.1 hypothetical protein GCM10010328_44580 [Streptomyces pluricolorescens]
MEITLARVSTDAAPAGIAVLRLIGMLPAQWECGQRIEEDRITVLVRGSGQDAEDVTAVRERCAEALRDRTLHGWVLEGAG